MFGGDKTEHADPPTHHHRRSRLHHQLPASPLHKLDLYGSRSSDLYHSELYTSKTDLYASKSDLYASKTDLYASKSDLYSSKGDLYSPAKSDIYGSRRELLSALKGSDIYGSKSEFLCSRRELYSPRGRGEEGGRGEGVWPINGGGGTGGGSGTAAAESGNFYESDSGVSSLYEPLSFQNGHGFDNYHLLRYFFSSCIRYLHMHYKSAHSFSTSEVIGQHLISLSLSLFVLL